MIITFYAKLSSTPKDKGKGPKLRSPKSSEYISKRKGMGHTMVSAKKALSAIKKKFLLHFNPIIPSSLGRVGRGYK